jgi:hypothetical protein
MGMFDNIIVDATILPDLTEGEKSLLNQVGGWQSKDFENILTDVYIVKDESLNFKHSFVDKIFPYKLQIKEFEWEETPTDAKPFPNAEENSLEYLMGSMRETNVRIVDLNYNGIFIFYTSVQENISEAAKSTKWYEFKGQAENGKIISITRLTN